jgi:hypothetical protein
MTSYLAIVRVVTNPDDDELTAGEVHAELAQVLATAPFPGAVGLAVVDVAEEQQT